MKAVKRFGYAVLGAVVAIGAVPAIAQTPVSPPPPGMPLQMPANTPAAQRIQQLTAELDLNQGQVARLIQITRVANVRRAAVMVNSSLTASQKFARIRLIRAMERGQLEYILSPGQLLRFRELASRR